MANTVEELERSNTFHSSDVEERIDELDDYEDKDEDEADELRCLIDFREACNSPEWRHGIAFISEDFFEDYAAELANDIYSIDESAWPFSCIDWKEAADALKHDYSAVELGNTTFYYQG